MDCLPGIEAYHQPLVSLSVTTNGTVQWAGSVDCPFEQGRKTGSVVRADYPRCSQVRVLPIADELAESRVMFVCGGDDCHAGHWTLHFHVVFQPVTERLSFVRHR
jgi:hypothetical protein